MWAAQGASPAVPHWPAIQPVRASATFTNLAVDSVDTPVSMEIADAAGHPAYRVECHNGYYDDEHTIDYSGDFQCGLFAARGDTVANLLPTATRDEESSDWFNRGRMLASQLAGRCASYPEYGAIRHFRVRGMRLTFEFRKLAWAPSTGAQPRLNGFTVDLSADPDPSAHTRQAAIVRVVKPPASCEPIS